MAFEEYKKKLKTINFGEAIEHLKSASGPEHHLRSLEAIEAGLEKFDRFATRVEGRNSMADQLLSGRDLEQGSQEDVVQKLREIESASRLSQQVISNELRLSLSRASQIHGELERTSSIRAEQASGLPSESFRKIKRPSKPDLTLLPEETDRVLQLENQLLKLEEEERRLEELLEEESRKKPKIGAPSQLSPDEIFRQRLDKFEESIRQLREKAISDFPHRLSGKPLRNSLHQTQEALIEVLFRAADLRRERLAFWEKNDFSDLAHRLRKRLSNAQIDTNLRRKNEKLLPELRRLQAEVEAIHTFSGFGSDLRY